MNGASSTYDLPAALPGEVSYLPISDAGQAEYAGYGKTTKITIPADQIAADLVQCFTNNFPGIFDSSKASPGIMVIAGDVATPEELAVMKAKQTEFARLTVLEADKFSGQQRFDKITHRHHALAEWLGVKGRPWQESLDKTTIQTCPFCGAKAAAFASKCPTCREVINPERYAQQKAYVDAGRMQELSAGVMAAQNLANRSVESITDADVDELMAAAGYKGQKKK
jgi:hypothetical protein